MALRLNTHLIQHARHDGLVCARQEGGRSCAGVALRLTVGRGLRLQSASAADLNCWSTEAVRRVNMALGVHV